MTSAHFLLRRLHSLFGLLPVGGFVMFHLWENSQSRLGAEHYNDKVVGWLQGLNYLAVMEIVMIALPLAFHALYGLLIIGGARPQPLRYPFLHNQLYLLQRASGVGILVFLVIHVGWTRIHAIWEPSIKADLYAHMQSLLVDPLILVIYAVGLLLAVIHLCFGLWSMGMTWGLTTTPRAQRISLVAFMGLSLPLLVMGAQGIAGFLP